LSLSNKTLTTVASIQTRQDEELYPDRSATTGEIRVNASTMMRLVDVPTVTKDMSDAAKWEYGDKVYGTMAKRDKLYKQYKRDIIRAKGKEYKDIYVNTLKPIGKQLGR
jgi:hypothetical protein